LCLYHNERITCKAANKPELTVTRHDPWAPIRILEQHSGKPVSPFRAYHAYSLCPWPVITNESYTLLEMYAACDGVRRIRTPDEYLRLPAKWVRVCRELDSVRAAVMEEHGNS